MMNNQRTYRRTGNLSVYVKGPNVASTIALDNLDLEFAQDDLDSYLRMVSTAFFVRGGNMLQSDIQSWIDVRDHGAVGDGITNDTNAVQAAIEAAETLGNLSTVYIPTGFNCLVDPLVITTGISIVGGGFTKQNNYQGNGTTYSIKESALTLRSGTRLFSPITNVTDISGFSLIGLSMYGRGREAGYDDGAVVGWGEGAASYGETDANTLATSKLSFRFCKFSNFGRNGIELSDAGFQLEICYNYFTNCGQFGGVSGGRGDLSLKRGGVFLYNNTFYRPTLGSTSGANADTGSVIKGNYFGGCARGIGVDGQAQHINYGEANLYEFCDVGIEAKNSIGLNITGAKFEGCYTAGVIAPTVISLGHFEHASSGSNSVQAATNYIYTKGSSLFLNRTSNGSSIELDISERATNDRGLYINATLPKTVYEVNGSSGANGLTRVQASGNGGVYFQVNTSTDRDFSTLLSWFYRDSTGNICLDTGGSGTVSFSNSRLTNLAAPTSSGDAVSLGYLSSVVTSLNSARPYKLITEFENVEANNSGFDNGPGFQAALDELSGTGIILMVPPGTWYFNTGITLNQDNSLKGYSDRVTELVAVSAMNLLTLNTRHLGTSIENLLLTGASVSNPVSKAIVAGSQATNALLICNIRLTSDTWYDGFYSTVETDMLVIDHFYNVGGIVGNAFIWMHLDNSEIAYSGCPILRNCNSGNQRIQYTGKNKYGISVQGVNSLSIQNCIINGFDINYDIQSKTSGSSNRLTLGVVIDNSMSEDFRTFVMDYYHWVSGTTLSASQTTRRIPTVPNGFVYEVSVGGTTGGSEPTWPTTVGATVTDGTVTWKNQGYHSRRWAASTLYPSGYLVKATKANATNGWVWQSSGGTSGSTEPVWGLPSDVTYGTTISDGTITWTAVVSSIGVKLSGDDSALKVTIRNHAMGPVLQQYEVGAGSLHLENVSSYTSQTAGVAYSDISYQFTGVTYKSSFSSKNSRLYGNFKPYRTSTSDSVYSSVYLDDTKIISDTIGVVNTEGSGIFGYYLGDVNRPLGGGISTSGTITIDPKSDRNISLIGASTITLADTNEMHKGKEINIISLTSATITITPASGSFNFLGLTLPKIVLNTNSGHIKLISKASGYQIISNSKYVPAHLSNTQPSATSEGGFTSGAYVARTLNQKTDPSTFVTTSGSSWTSFSLPEGVYTVKCAAPAFNVGSHKIRLRNTTAPLTIITSSAVTTGSGVQTIASAEGTFALSQASNIEVQHICQTTNSTDGLGQATSLDTEVYTTVVINKHI